MEMMISKSIREMYAHPSTTKMSIKVNFLRFFIPFIILWTSQSKENPVDSLKKKAYNTMKSKIKLNQANALKYLTSSQWPRFRNASAYNSLMSKSFFIVARFI
jgi:hypothetical protein